MQRPGLEPHHRGRTPGVGARTPAPAPTSASASNRRRRRTAVVALALVMAAAIVAGCGSATDTAETGTGTGSSPSTTAAGSAPGDASAFPVTVDHTYGSTTIEAKPEKVVTVGLTDHDAVLALGTVPIGVADWLKIHPGAFGPWAAAALGDAPVPEIISDATAINYEQIAAMDPDVILGLYSGLTESEYDTPSQIAPTVAQPGDLIDYGISWQDQTRTVGAVLGESARAETLVAEVEAQFAAALAENPAAEGAEGLVATIYDGKVSIYGPEDGRGRLLASLGFTQPAEIEDLAEGTFSADVSRERIDLVDVDVLVWIVADVETDTAKFAADPLYSNLPVHTGGHDVFIANGSDEGSALSFQSVLSVPFLLDSLVPQLTAAHAGTASGTSTSTSTSGG